MNIKTVSDKLLHNWPIKLLCLVVAIFLYIFHQTSLVDHKNFVVPLKVIENGQVTHVNKIPDSVTISVKALPDDMSNIHSSDFTASLDLSYISEEGDYIVPISIDVKNEFKKFETLEIKIKPNPSVSVKVEQKIAKYIPLKASISGEPAHGYKVDSVLLDPSTVCVIGPASIVNKIPEIYTDKVVVSNAEVNFSTEVSYLSVNKMIYVPEKGPYKATVIIAAEDTNRLFNDVAVIPFYLSDKLMLDGPVSSISMTVNGTVPVLENYNLGKNVLQIDLSQITEPGEYDLPVAVYLPSYLSLSSLSQDTVHVKIIEQPVIEETEEETQE